MWYQVTLIRDVPSTAVLVAIPFVQPMVGYPNTDARSPNRSFYVTPVDPSHSDVGHACMQLTRGSLARPSWTSSDRSCFYLSSWAALVLTWVYDGPRLNKVEAQVSFPCIILRTCSAMSGTGIRHAARFTLSVCNARD